MEVRGRSRKNKGRVAIRRRIKAWMSMVLTAAMVMGNMAASVNTVLASPSVTKEEFRLRAAAIQKAAEKALDEGEAITEEILLDGKDKSVLKEYQEMFKADGRLYELDILKDLETVKDVSGVTLRVFMRLPKEADPKTHVLNGEEELYFLYVNDGDESVTARLNIEGLISGFSTVRPYEAVFGERESILENQETAEEGSAAEAEETEEGKVAEENGETAEGEESKPAGGSGGSGGGSGSGSGNSGVHPSEGTEGTESPEENSKEENTAGNTESGEEKNEDSGNAEDADNETTADEAENPEHKTENPEDSVKDTNTENKNETDTKTETENKTESEDKTENGDKTEDKGNTETADDGQGKDSSHSDTGKADTANQENSADKAETSGQGSSSGSTENTGNTSGNTDSSGKDSASDKNDSSSEGSSSDKGSLSDKDSSSDKNSSSDGDRSSGKSETSDKGSSNQEGSSDKSSSSENKEDSGNKDSAGETADNRLGISLNQILRVAEPEGLAETEEALPETEPETETEDTAAEETETEAEETETEETESETEETFEETVPETEEDKTEDEGSAAEETSEVSEEVPEITGESGEDENSNDDEDDEAFAEIEDGEEAESTAVKEEEKDPFGEKGVLEGKLYNLVAFESGLTARAFVTTLEKLGMNKEDLIEGGHILTYSISPVGSAVIVNGPELVRDEAKVSFGVVPQTGYKIAGVMANGVNLEEVSGENVASSSDARLASASETGEGAVYYVIPSVLEDQEVEIILAEETEEDSIKAGSLTAVADGYTVRVDFDIEAEIPEGAELEVTPVSDTALDYIRYELLNLEEPGTEDQEYALDIKIIADGQEIQPSAPVLVTIGLAGSEEVSDASVYHFPGTSAESIELAAREESAVSTFTMARSVSVQTELPVGEELEATAGEEGIRFYTEGFSVFYGKSKDQPSTLSDDMPDSNPNFIIVQKTFTGIEAKDIPADFEIKVANNDIGKEYSLSSICKDPDIIFSDLTANTNEVVWSWKIKNADVGKYMVSENNYEVMDKSVKTEVKDIKGEDILCNENGKWEIIVAAAEIEVNTGKIIHPNNRQDFKFGNGQFFACTLTSNSGVMVITEKSLSASQRKAIQAELKTCNGPWGGPYYFYSIEENGITFSVAGKVITYQASNNNLHISDTSNWQMVVMPTYNTTKAQNPEIAITNEYTLKTTNFVVNKILKDGNSFSSAAVRDVTFQLYKTDASWSISGDSYQLFGDPVTMTGDQTIEDNNKVGRFEFTDLPIGYYYLEETLTTGGYKLLENKIKIEVAAENGVLNCYYYTAADVRTLITNDGFNVVNEPAYTAVLPDTGGPGLGLIKEFGWVLLLLALMMAGMEVQYYGERRKRVRVDEIRTDEQRYEEP